MFFRFIVFPRGVAGSQFAHIREGRRVGPSGFFAPNKQGAGTANHSLIEAGPACSEARIRMIHGYPPPRMQGGLSRARDRTERFHGHSPAAMDEIGGTVAHVKMVPLQRQVAVRGSAGNAQFVGRMVHITPYEFAILEGEKTIALRQVELQGPRCGNRALRHCVPLVASRLNLVFTSTTQRKTRAKGDPCMLVSQPEPPPRNPHRERPVAIQREEPNTRLPRPRTDVGPDIQLIEKRKPRHRRQPDRTDRMHAKPNHSEISPTFKTINLKPPRKSRLDGPGVVFPMHKKQIVPVLIHHRTPRGPHARFKQSLRGLVHC